MEFRKTDLSAPTFPPVIYHWPFQRDTSFVFPHCHLIMLSISKLAFSFYASSNLLVKLDRLSGKSCSSVYRMQLSFCIVL